MNLLLDTHTLIWWRTKSAALSTGALAAIADPSVSVYVSAGSAWEIATKFRLRKLEIDANFVADFLPEIQRAGFFPLAITVSHGLRAGLFKGEHKDPFDRMLIAQALEEDLTVISNETGFDRFGVKRMW